jgi:hypothetical protein
MMTKLTAKTLFSRAYSYSRLQNNDMLQIDQMFYKFFQYESKLVKSVFIGLNYFSICTYNEKGVYYQIDRKVRNKMETGEWDLKYGGTLLGEDKMPQLICYNLLSNSNSIISI